MDSKITFSTLIYRARAIARIKGKNEFDIFDILISAISLDDEWTEEKFLLKKMTGLSKDCTDDVSTVIDKAKSFDEPDKVLKKKITFNDKVLQEELLDIKKKYQKDTDEGICKRVVYKVVETAHETDPDYLKLLGFESSLYNRFKLAERVAPVKEFLSEKKGLIESLKNKVVGQDQAIDRLAGAFAGHMKKASLEHFASPSCVFLIGDVGSGKTTLATEFVRNMPGSWGNWQSKYLNAKQFDDLRTHDIERLLFNEDGFFSVIKVNPSIVFIIDEIYEASSGFFDIMQQILGEGRYLRSSNEFSFTRAFFILITNQGEKLYNKHSSGVFSDSISFPREVFVESLMDDRTRQFHNDSEKKKSISSLLDKVDEFIVLKRLTFYARKIIIRNLLVDRARFWKENYHVERLSFGDELVEILAFSSLHITSCRQIQKHIIQTVFNEVESGIVNLYDEEKIIENIELRLEQEGFIESYLEHAGVGKGNRFLYIDDTADYHDIIRKLGFDQALFANSVAQAKNIVNENGLKNLDWILLDLIFPEGEPDGLSFLSDFRKKHKLFPVHLFSTRINSLKEFFDITRAGGAAGFIEKSATLTSGKDNKQKKHALEELKEKLDGISKETASEQVAKQLHKKAESLNIVASSSYTGKSNTLLFEITNFKREPRLLIQDTEFDIVYPDVTFNDIKGQSNTVEEINRWLGKLKNNRYTKSDKGILLYGPPGTGKTLVAKAIASEIEAFFISITPAQLQSKWVGESEAAVRKLFANARKNQPSVIFIDEIESIGSRANFSGEHSWQSSFVNSFLAEMDGFDENEEVFVIGATNHKEQIDAALIRPGRLGRHILVPLPRTMADRKEIFLHYLNKAWLKNEISDKDLELIAKITKGISPADIMFMVELAQDIASREGKAIIDADSFAQARTELLLGKVSRESHKPETLRVVACHEAGHALVSRKLGMEVYQVTVLMRESDENILGFSESIFDDVIKDRETIINKIAICMAGREAEKIVLGKYYDGALNDLKRAQMYAESILVLGLTESGLPEILTPANERAREANEYNAETSRKITGVLKEGQDRCTKLLVDNKKELENMISRLIDEKTIFFND